ncbi:lysozyme inhibitor LprI family protein [Azospirillum doebereinerae]|uniref:DUF1311 domain-containing protein n=1 Tax=Azospirillum doebereinerae TaxID=92933 RepID=A0A3S0WZB4_9PROT|nr:lysozyme inhibitor LprI family protein [Azospirillum doebereinerae]RUQ71357.1 DUF1311 domain-containing protein [Azospirillum doebereinerae]
MRFRLIPALVLLALPSAAGAASFPCAKASTATETAICADSVTSKLDERLSAAYRAALKRLSGASPEDGAAGTAVKADQKAWIADRNACGNAVPCLRMAYERRLAVLSFRPDPGAPKPADRYVGTFDYEGFVGIAAMALRDGRVAVSVSGAEPTNARWVCDFSGVGSLDAAGRLVVGTPNDEGEGLVLQAKGTSVVEIPETPHNKVASSNWCGFNGSVLFEYRRK